MAIEDFGDVLGIRTFVSRANIVPGKVVQFTYDGNQKYALVLNPNWQGKMHALSLRALTPSILSELVVLIGDETDGEVLYDKFKNSKFVDNRPYRTYLLSKMSTLREVFIKKPAMEIKNVTGDIDAKQP